jgi:hypothetical protein
MKSGNSSVTNPGSPGLICCKERNWCREVVLMNLKSEIFKNYEYEGESEEIGYI